MLENARAHLGHYWSAVIIFYVSKRHLCALVLVDFQLWEVDIGYVIQRLYKYYESCDARAREMEGRVQGNFKEI